MQSGSLEQVRSVADTRGKHRISAELKRLEQEARFLEVSLCLFVYFRLFGFSVWIFGFCVLNKVSFQQFFVIFISILSLSWVS